MATKRQKEYKTKVRGFTDKVKCALEKEVYPIVFNHFRRRTDKDKFLGNDSIAGWANLCGHTVGVQEKYVRADTYNKYGKLYFEVAHTDANGRLVYGVGMRSKANVIVYAIYDEDTDKLIETHFLSVKWLQDEGARVLREWNVNGIQPIDLRCYQSSNKLKTGGYYTVYSYEFDLNLVPDCAYVRIQDEPVRVVEE